MSYFLRDRLLLDLSPRIKRERKKERAKERKKDEMEGGERENLFASV